MGLAQQQVTCGYQLRDAGSNEQRLAFRNSIRKFLEVDSEAASFLSSFPANLEIEEELVGCGSLAKGVGTALSAVLLLVLLPAIIASASSLI